MFASVRHLATVSALLACMLDVPAAPVAAQYVQATARPTALPIAVPGTLKVIAVHRDTGAIETVNITGQPITVTITAHTTFSEDSAPAAFADVTPGIFIAVGYAIQPPQPGAGSGASPNSPAATTWPAGPATTITILLPTVGGVVTRINDGTLVVAGFDALPHFVAITPSTHIERAGQPVTTRVLSAGAVVAARGIDNPDGSLTARRITIQLPMLTGVIAALTASTIAITGDYGLTATIATTPATIYRMAGGRPAGRAQLAAGKRISAEGSLAADGTLAALRIVLLGPPWRCLGIDQPAGGAIPPEPCYPPCPLPPSAIGTSGSTPAIACAAPLTPSGAAQ